MTPFFHFFALRENIASFELCVSPVLSQNQHNLNFFSSQTLNKGKLISYSKSLWYAIVSSVTHFFILFGMRKKWPGLDKVFHLY